MSVRNTVPQPKTADGWVIIIRFPKSYKCEDELVGYGFGDQPYPEQLLTRGHGVIFPTMKDAEKALQASIKLAGDAEFVKRCKFHFVPVFKP